MELQSIISADYLDIIFNNRNKSYGGYELRKNYNRRAIKSITLVVSTAFLLIALQAFTTERRSDIQPPTMHGPTDLGDLIFDEPKPQIKIEPPQPAASAATAAYTTLKIEPDDKVITNPPTQEELAGKEIGKVNTEGNGGTEAATTEILTTGTGKPYGGFTESPPPVPEAPHEYVDQKPEFDGNVYEYLGRNIQYPQMARETQTTGRVVIKFVINEDGSVSGARVLKGIGAGCEEEALRVINSMPKWKPGKNNGKAVKCI